MTSVADQEVRCHVGGRDRWIPLASWLRRPKAAEFLDTSHVFGLSSTCWQFRMRNVSDVRPRFTKAEALRLLGKRRIVAQAVQSIGILLHFPDPVQVDVTIHLAEVLEQMA